jgi:hypothetical protein
MIQPMRNTLIRAYTMDMRRNHGNVVVAEINFRRVSYNVLTKPGQQFNTSGAVLIDAGEALAPIGGAIQRNVGLLVMVYQTDEVLWIPTRADLGVSEYWTIEMVPWVDYLRDAAVDDDELIRLAHQRAENEETL